MVTSHDVNQGNIGEAHTPPAPMVVQDWQESAPSEFPVVEEIVTREAPDTQWLAIIALLAGLAVLASWLFFANTPS